MCVRWWGVRGVRLVHDEPLMPNESVLSPQLLLVELIKYCDVANTVCCTVGVEVAFTGHHQSRRIFSSS